MFDLSTGKKYADLVNLVNETTLWIANKNEISKEQVMVTCGATGALDAALSLFSSGARLAAMPYEYFDIQLLAKVRGVQIVTPPVSGDINNIDEFISFLSADLPDACYVSLPNNPLGQEYPAEKIAKIFHVMEGRTVIVDQTLLSKNMLPASWFKSEAKQTRLLVVRSFSKSHGLVGERVGYIMSFSKIFRFHPYAHAPAASSLKKVHRIWQSTESKKAMDRILANNGLMETWSVSHPQYHWTQSHSNFGCLHLTDTSAQEIAAQLKRKEFLMKTSSELGCAGNFLRLYLAGNPKIMARFLRALPYAQS